MTRVDHERSLWLARRILPHEPALRNWLRSRQVAGLEIDDIVQDTYAILAALESVEEIRDPKNYAFQTAYRLILGHLRRAKVVSIRGVPNLDVLGVVANEASPEQLLSDRDELHQLAQAIAGLPPRTREVFTLRRVEGLHQREVAGRLRISEGAVEKHMAKAIRVLAFHFERGRKTLARASKPMKASAILHSQSTSIPD
jgi:RNA polymerase sigma-70 factor (ECF subfamily)